MTFMLPSASGAPGDAYQNPGVIAELRAARREDVAGKFKPWKPRHH